MIEINKRKITNSEIPYTKTAFLSNNNGSIIKRNGYIKVSKECGDDAIKIQKYKTDSMTIDKTKEEL